MVKQALVLKYKPGFWVEEPGTYSERILRMKKKVRGSFKFLSSQLVFGFCQSKASFPLPDSLHSTRDRE